MTRKEAERYSCNYHRSKGSGRTRSIVSDNATFRTVMACAAFALAIYAVPTLMALLKCWGVW
ncbi:MAG: hypothetical protein IKF14_05110 [Atopobiaceae bacterium]|nr:hypothetical protein [Atopobiaceae bacterium]MBR3158468.1 hypothetical protein [Atopobiaceae bacterium]